MKSKLRKERSEEICDRRKERSDEAQRILPLSLLVAFSARRSYLRVMRRRRHVLTL